MFLSILLNMGSIGLVLTGKFGINEFWCLGPEESGRYHLPVALQRTA